MDYACREPSVCSCETGPGDVENEPPSSDEDDWVDGPLANGHAGPGENLVEEAIGNLTRMQLGYHPN
ncbi:hypothetical protein MMC06_001324 [Schaereria dolodes]|nr:hypothetical protein [Schaereria dolodes]